MKKHLLRNAEKKKEDGRTFMGYVIASLIIGLIAGLVLGYNAKTCSDCSNCVDTKCWEDLDNCYRDLSNWKDETKYLKMDLNDCWIELDDCHKLKKIAENAPNQWKQIAYNYEKELSTCIDVIGKIRSIKNFSVREKV